jgi:hypothetical protein
LPLGEEFMLASSESKLAEGAAKQIYRIRERRTALLTADVEHLPADGSSFNAMLEGMNKMERELTELFVGKTTIEPQIQTLIITPDSEQNNKILFRFSALRGVVQPDDLSGIPFYMNIKPNTLTPSDTKTKEKKEKIGLYTLLPTPTHMSIW